MIPYGKQSIDESDIQAVIDVLKSDYLTGGNAVKSFELDVCAFLGSKYTVAISSGTAALHAVMQAIDITDGDEVIVPAITFAATANCVLYCGGTPVFADVNPDTLLIDTQSVIKRITPQTKAIIVMDYAGQPCNYPALRRICDIYGLVLISDACHSFGGAYNGIKVGRLADLTCFSFHPVKAITTGEGGMVVTDHLLWAERIRRFRNHGRNKLDMINLGYNYRLSDIQCALGASQLARLLSFISRRNQIAERYHSNLGPNVNPLFRLPDRRHAYHLFVGRSKERDSLRKKLLDNGIGSQIHYQPVHELNYYVRKFGKRTGLCPNAEKAYSEILSLPIYPDLTDDQVDYICEVINS